jgi:hypothetical protein
MLYSALHKYCARSAARSIIFPLDAARGRSHRLTRRGIKCLPLMPRGAF